MNSEFESFKNWMLNCRAHYEGLMLRVRGGEVMRTGLIMPKVDYEKAWRDRVRSDDFAMQMFKDEIK